MELNYHEIASELDAREILRYLNQLGIRNISGEILKHFISDLKKLIKYDLKQREENTNANLEQGPERLHSASTFSSRIRSKNNEGIPRCKRECPGYRHRPFDIRNIHSASAPNIGHQVPQEHKELRRACSCVRVEKKPESLNRESRGTSSYNLIKVQKQPTTKKCDPVSLYHYYTSLWAKFKPNVPGENDWADLRWSVRQKMAGSLPGQTVSKSSEGKCSALKKRP